MLTNLQVNDPKVGPITCPRTTLPPPPDPNATVVCTASYTVTQADIDAKVLMNTAQATATNTAGQTVPSNPSSVTLILGNTPALLLQKFVDTPGPYTIGMEVDYHYDLINIGTVPLSNFAVTDDIVPGVVCDQVLASPLAAREATFASATTCRGSYVIRAQDIDAVGNLTNVAIGQAQTEAEQVVMSNTATLTLPVGTDIAVAKTVDQPTPFVGDVVTYTVTATNQGAVDATGLGLTDVVPAGSVLVSAAPAPGTTYDPASGAWTIGALARGKSVTLTLMARVTALGAQTNVASVSMLDQFDPNPDNDRAEVTITPQPPSPGVTKTFSPSAVTVGETSTLTITLTNPTAIALTGAALTDTLPAGLTTVAGTAATTCSGTVTQTAGTVQLAGGTIPPNGSCTVTVMVTATAPGNQENVIPAGGLTTDNAGGNTVPADATLVVVTVSVGRTRPSRHRP